MLALILVLEITKQRKNKRESKMKLTSKGRFAVTSLVDLALNSSGK